MIIINSDTSLKHRLTGRSPLQKRQTRVLPATMRRLSTAVLLRYCVTALLLGVTAALNVQDFLPPGPLTKARIVEEVLQYYQQEDPRGIPVLELPEELVLPVTATVTSGVTINGDLSVKGLSDMKIQYAKFNVTDLTAALRLRFPHIGVTAPFEEAGIWSTSEGVMTANISTLDVAVALAVARNPATGHLWLSEIRPEVTQEELSLVFDPASVTLSIAMAAADTMFGTIVDLALGKRIDGIKERVNAKLEDKMASQGVFPPGLPPIDMIIKSGILQGIQRRGEGKLDPLVIPDKTIELAGGGVTVKVSGLVFRGLGGLHRSGEVSVQLIDDKLLATLQVGIAEVKVDAAVEVEVLGAVTALETEVEARVGGVSVWLEVEQAMDVRRPPLVRRLQVDLGEVSLLSSGEATASYLLEAAGSGLLNGLRRPLASALQPRLMQKIQARLDTVDVDGRIRAKFGLPRA